MKIRLFQKGFNFSQDGPGNRMVYHLQGCNLVCPWCSNPEGLCCSGGTEYTVEQLVADAVSCRMMFFEGGGVTLTGGEVTMQFAAIREFLTRLKEENIHTCIETNGIHPKLPELFPLIDYLIMDCKHYDPEAHRRITGVENSMTLRNLELAIAAGKHPAVRIPLIGGFNAGEADAAGFSRLFQQIHLPGNGTLELLTYHEYGKEKYKKLGLPYTMTEQARITPDMLRRFAAILHENGIDTIRS